MEAHAASGAPVWWQREFDGVHPLKVQGCQNNVGELSFLWGVSMLWRVLTSIASAQEKPVSKPVNAATSGSG